MTGVAAAALRHPRRAPDAEVVFSRCVLVAGVRCRLRPDRAVEPEDLPSPVFSRVSVKVALERSQPEASLPSDAPVPGVDERLGLVYRRRGNTDLLLDLFLPTLPTLPDRPTGHERPRIGIIVVHGGGWERGERSIERPFARQRFAPLNRWPDNVSLDKARRPLDGSSFLVGFSQNDGKVDVTFFTRSHPSATIRADFGLAALESHRPPRPLHRRPTQSHRRL